MTFPPQISRSCAFLFPCISVYLLLQFFFHLFTGGCIPIDAWGNNCWSSCLPGEWKFHLSTFIYIFAIGSKEMYQIKIMCMSWMLRLPPSCHPCFTVTVWNTYIVLDTHYDVSLVYTSNPHSIQINNEWISWYAYFCFGFTLNPINSI